MDARTNNTVLYVVATPIGNLDDMTPRAIRILKEVDLIAAEDTRRIKNLLSHFGISGKELVSYYDHMEQKKAAYLIEKIIEKNLALALVSDAGTPCVSDPGYRLISEARRKHVKVCPIPGASALTSIVSAAGLPCDRFVFIGFLPPKDAALKKEIESWETFDGASVIFFEATRRLKQALASIYETFPDSTVAVGRELTKLFEEIEVMPIKECIAWAAAQDNLRGEVTVMVSPNKNEDSESLENKKAMIQKKAVKEFRKGASLKDMLKEFKDCGFSRSELYHLLLEVKPE